MWQLIALIVAIIIAFLIALGSRKGYSSDDANWSSYSNGQAAGQMVSTQQTTVTTTKAATMDQPSTTASLAANRMAPTSNIRPLVGAARKSILTPRAATANKSFVEEILN